MGAMIRYEGRLYRPPSEANSLILQATLGCSYTECAFCGMYRGERYVELAGGADALVAKASFLRAVLEALREAFPDLRRVSCYASPQSLQVRTVEEMAELRELGLSLYYVGCESGDDLVLERISKGESFASSLAALEKIRAAKARSSVMILNGVGGRRYSEQHALHSAQLMNAAQPDYLSTLVVSFPLGMQRFASAFNGAFEPLDQAGLFRELRWMLGALDLRQTIFRSDHASNYLVLKGTLNRDRARLLRTLDLAIERPGSVPLRQEWQRGL